ncbi:LytR/AlgR family response regulator transcription factor [Faecalibaculum rodentium]|uniref:Stage 0 sporulation protein A homolog n=1 Tax=Faecalibaculum rodentium TaxID=1702221 RepID=A0A1Q9YJW1_9FIRM|nr:LytTR family DNA-binding domain-containing protein [Faecalibaculum rodentium]OLU44811.1 hypothetical protein BO223_07015 [Faecalibaculum rodentium]
MRKVEQNSGRELVLCENDPLQREDLIRTISELFPDLRILPVTGADQLFRLLKKPGDRSGSRIYLMDVVLDNGEDGISLARRIHRLDPEAPIVFMSAFLEKSCEVYDVEHCYFIYKPQKEKRLKAALTKAIRQLETATRPLVIHEGTSIHRLNPASILCMERVRRCTYITCRNCVLKARENLNELLAMLPDNFVQCHRSYVVNYAMTAGFYGTEFELTNGLRIPVSRTRQAGIRQSYQEFLIREKSLC